MKSQQKNAIDSSPCNSNNRKKNGDLSKYKLFLQASCISLELTVNFVIDYLIKRFTEFQI